MNSNKHIWNIRASVDDILQKRLETTALDHSEPSSKASAMTGTSVLTDVIFMIDDGMEGQIVVL